MRRSTLLLASLLLAALPAGLAAQGVTGTVVDGRSGAPVPGALVTLVSDDGRVQARVLADRAGTFALRAPAAGRYTLRAERVGYATASSPPLELGAGQVVTYRLAPPAGRGQLQAPGATRGGGPRPGTGGAQAGRGAP